MLLVPLFLALMLLAVPLVPMPLPLFTLPLVLTLTLLSILPPMLPLLMLMQERMNKQNKLILCVRFSTPFVLPPSTPPGSSHLSSRSPMPPTKSVLSRQVNSTLLALACSLMPSKKPAAPRRPSSTT